MIVVQTFKLLINITLLRALAVTVYLFLFPFSCRGQKDLVFYGWGRADTMLTKTVELPPVFDLRDFGRTGAVKTQPKKGCWAAASLSSLESTVLSAGYGDFTFSAKNLQDFHGFDSTRSTFGNHHMSTAYFARGSGPVIEGSYFDTVFTLRPRLPLLVTEAVFLPNNPEIIKKAVMEYGSVYSMLHFSYSFYNDSTQVYCLPLAKPINHTMNIAGWNDTIEVPDGKGAWIVQDSKGTQFGDAGYCYICYGDINFPAYNAIYTEWMDYRNEMNILYHDTCGTYHSYGFNNPFCYGLVTLRSEVDADISMIGVSVNAPETSVIASIYTVFDTVEKQPGGLMYSSEKQLFRYPGYYTIKTGGNVKVRGGEDFFVMLRYETPDSDQPLPVEVYIKDYCDPHITSGACWVNPDFEQWPQTWYECGRESKWPNLNFDISVKVYTLSD